MTSADFFTTNITTPSVFNDKLLSDDSSTHNMALPGSTVISDDLLYWVQLVNYIGLCGFISILGIIANIINIIVFIRQGVLSDSSTVSLLGLAVSDLMCLITLLWFAICFSIIYAKPMDINFDPVSLLVVTAGRPHGMFIQITCLITVYISFERCMCVVFPFKFKLIFTTKRTAIVIPSIFIVTIVFLFIPLYANEYLRWQLNSRTNTTILAVYQEDNYAEVYKVCSFINAQVIRTLSLLSIFVFTQITAWKVDASSKWRKTITSSGPQSSSTLKGSDTSGDVTTSTSKPKGNADGISRKDQKLVRMIRVICIIFLICYTGDLLCVTSERIEPDIRPGGKYNNVFFFMYAFSFVLGAFNSSSNILVYYKMSSKYRREFRRLFGFEDAKK